METGLKSILFLQRLKNFGPVKINSLLDKHSDPNDSDGFKELVRIQYGIGDEEMLEAEEYAEVQAERLLQVSGLRAITVFDSDYPIKLNDLGKHRPPLLYARGNVQLLHSEGIAVVGTRSPTLKAVQLGKTFVRNVLSVNPDLVIVSGLAVGCDSIAHCAALENTAKTLAVLPSGIDVITPNSNSRLAERILESDGCLCSEYGLGILPSKEKFVRRDEIMAAVAEHTAIIQCSTKSGTMHTADAAIKLKRNLGCLSFNGMGEEFEGNKYLLSQNKAAQIAKESDVEGFLRSVEKDTPRVEQLSLF